LPYLDSLHWSFGDFGGLIQVANRRGPRATRSAPQATEWRAREVPVCPPGEVQGGGPGEGLFLADHSLLAPMVIALRERRLTSGFDHYVPIILRDGVVYDGQLDRFFLDLPLNGVRSPHTLRAYGYDIMVWVRFLEEARGKAVWFADRSDVTAFHRARRHGDAGWTAAFWRRKLDRPKWSTL
jgi:hypothetical protein